MSTKIENGKYDDDKSTHVAQMFSEICRKCKENMIDNLLFVIAQ